MLKPNIKNKLKKKISKKKPFPTRVLKVNKNKSNFPKVFKKKKHFSFSKPNHLLKITEDLKTKYLPFNKNILGSLTSTSQKF
jgi:hypothetical protein